VAKPKVFVASSSEGLEVATAIQGHLDSVAEVTIWDQDVFQPSDNILGSIRQAAQNSDYAIFVFTPDDTLVMRDQTVSTARDNVLFELGLFIGAIGLENTIIVHPGRIRDFHLPSDLAGINILSYDSSRSDANLVAALASACARMRRVITTHRAGPSDYLRRYVSQEEHTLVDPATSETRVSFDRAYKLLLYMFKCESFRQFRAFDLAFERWEELLKQDLFQTFNVSNEIFDSVDRLLEDGRCPDFRRILVVTFDQLKKPSSSETLRRFLQQEESWRARFSGVTVETRIVLYPHVSSRETRDRIRQLHDFALFTGDQEAIAIVETTLTSPTDRVSSPEFVVATSPETAIRLGTAFDGFWRSSQSLTMVLARLEALTAEGEDLRPPVRAHSIFMDACPEVDEDCAIVIEAGYLDLRSPSDEDRMVHLDDAFWLLESIQLSCEQANAPILLEAFVNDFSTANICQITACGPADNLTDVENRELLIHDLKASLQRRYAFYDIAENDFALFGMRSTRNAITRTLSRALKTGRPGIVERRLGDTTVDIYADSYTEHILLGYRDAQSSAIIPRCAALMAQHYRDLYEFARGRQPTLKELWIFDFNRLTERESVRLGAEAAFVLFSWPDAFELNIVNCNYSGDGRTGSVNHVSGPR
jgi:hypothetical protein